MPLSLSLVLVITAGTACGRKTRSADEKGSRSAGADEGMPASVAGMDPAGGAGRVKVRFLGFSQSRDAKERLVRFSLENVTSRTIRAVRVVLRYASAKGEPRGAFPLEITRPRGAALKPGATLSEQFEILGQQGPVDEVARVTFVVDRVTYADGTVWKRPPAKK